LLSILRIFIIISVIILVIFIYVDMLKKDNSYVVLPFETIGIKDNQEGKPFATLLSFDLQNIKNIYKTGPDRTQKGSNGRKLLHRPLANYSVPNNLSKNVQLDYSLSQIGTIGAEGISLSIGNVLLFIKGALGRGPNTITCSIQRYNSTIILVAILDQQSKIMTFEDAFENRFIISNEEQIPSLINDLAYKISLALCKQSNVADKWPQNWQTFKYVTQARDAYNSYMLTKDAKDLDKGYNMTMLAKEFEPEYNGTFELLSALGFNYLEGQNYDKAEMIFENISDFMPFESTLGLGVVYSNRNQSYYISALKAFDKATQLRPNDALAWDNKGIILNKMGNYSNIYKAMMAFNEAIGLDHNHIDPIAWCGKGDALTNLGIFENNTSRYKEAIAAYDMSIKIKPKGSEAWYGKGNALANLGWYEEAKAAYDMSIEINSSFEEALVNRKIVLAAQGNDSE